MIFWKFFTFIGNVDAIILAYHVGLPFVYSSWLSTVYPGQLPVKKNNEKLFNTWLF